MPTKKQETKEATEIMIAEPSKEQVDKIIKYHVWGAVGAGFVPLPLVDYVAFTGIQLNMLRQLAKAYNVPFLKQKVKNVLSPLISAAVPGVVGGPLALSLAKMVPFLGQTAGVVMMPVVAGAVTYAIGKVFNQHFASGGTFLTFDPEQVKAFYAKMLEEGKKVAANKQ